MKTIKIEEYYNYIICQNDCINKRNLKVLIEICYNDTKRIIQLTRSMLRFI